RPAGGEPRAARRPGRRPPRGDPPAPHPARGHRRRRPPPARARHRGVGGPAMRPRPWPLRYTVPGIILGGGALIVIAAGIHQFSTTTQRGVEQLREHALFVATTAAAEIEADGRAGAPSRWSGTVRRLANDRRLRL